jgi:hypothetical protein
VHAEVDPDVAVQGLGFLDRFGNVLPVDQAVAEGEEPDSFECAESFVFVLEAGGASDQSGVLVN